MAVQPFRHQTIDRGPHNLWIAARDLILDDQVEDGVYLFPLQVRASASMIVFDPSLRSSSSSSSHSPGSGAMVGS